MAGKTIVEQNLTLTGDYIIDAGRELENGEFNLLYVKGILDVSGGHTIVSKQHLRIFAKKVVGNVGHEQVLRVNCPVDDGRPSKPGKQGIPDPAGIGEGRDPSPHGKHADLWKNRTAEPGKPGRKGGKGGNGGHGGDATPGTDGQNGRDIMIFAEEFVGNLVVSVEARGGHGIAGAPGGNGGKGGKGGAGGMGGNGGSGVPGVDHLFGRGARGGNAGPGGNGGRGGDAGRGADGSDGGDGGSLKVFFHEEGGHPVWIDANIMGGRGGTPGANGVPGEGGDPGENADPGRGGYQLRTIFGDSEAEPGLLAEDLPSEIKARRGKSGRLVPTDEGPWEGREGASSMMPIEPEWVEPHQLEAFMKSFIGDHIV